MSLQFEPSIVNAQSELAVALEEGKIACPGYKLLDIQERQFVQYVIFGGLTPTQAAKLVFPGRVNPSDAGRRMAARKDVLQVMSELGHSKDEYWLAQLRNQKDMSLRKLSYIRDMSDDEALAAACADKIWGRANEEIKNHDKNNQDDVVTGVKFLIVAAPAPVHLGGDKYNPDDIIEITPEEMDKPKSGLDFTLNFEAASKENYGEK